MQRKMTQGSEVSEVELLDIVNNLSNEKRQRKLYQNLLIGAIVVVLIMVRSLSAYALDNPTRHNAPPVRIDWCALRHQRRDRRRVQGHKGVQGHARRLQRPHAQDGSFDGDAADVHRAGARPDAARVY